MLTPASALPRAAIRFPSTLPAGSVDRGGSAAATDAEVISETRPEPRDLARQEDFGYPTYGTPAAVAFVERLVAESADSAVDARAQRSPRAAAQDYRQKPPSTLVQGYSDLLRSGTPTAAADYRRAVVTAFGGGGSAEGGKLDGWFDNVATFLRRMKDLGALVLARADDNTRPFAEAELERHTNHGLRMLRAVSAPPAALATVDSVVQQAQQERSRRVAEVDHFFQRAQSGGAILGVPCTNHHHTYWLRDGRFIFYDLNAALSMAARPVHAGTFDFRPVSYKRFKKLQNAPLDFQGARPTTIEFVDPHFVKKTFDLSEDKIKTIHLNADPDGDHRKDRYRVDNGPWLPFPQPTSYELEHLKAKWFATLQAQAQAAIP